jgi:HD-like signal output (HDOD) protein/ActR/RegA family two-component response regulator
MTQAEAGEKKSEATIQESASGIVATAARPKRRILFADDEANVLQGLRSVLRPQRHEWEMVFATGGPAALEEITKGAFDVVVTDMRMPIVDGAELLRQTKELQPKAVRLVLSGQTDADTALKTVFTAHQFLAKPCDIENLRSVVTRACRLHELITSDELRGLAGDVSILPAAPRTYLAITHKLADPTCSLSEVAGIVERDPALCAKVLQVVNSAFFGLPRSVSSIAQATNYLGTLALRNLALAMETMAAASRAKLPLSNQELLAFQTNSLLTGMLGRRWFAAERRKADEAFVAGMLRDMGHLVLAAQGRTAVTDPECHGALGAYLLGLWGIPHGVLEPVAFHEHPERVEHDKLEVVDVVHLADQIAAELAPSPFASAATPLDLERLARLGASLPQVEQLRTEAKDLLARTRELLKS